MDGETGFSITSDSSNHARRENLTRGAAADRAASTTCTGAGSRRCSSSRSRRSDADRDSSEFNLGS